MADGSDDDVAVDMRRAVGSEEAVADDVRRASPVWVEPCECRLAVGSDPRWRDALRGPAAALPLPLLPRSCAVRHACGSAT